MRQRGSSDGGSVLHIHHVELIDYVMPMLRAFSTARGSVRSSRNTVVVLTGRVADREVVGFGEANPRNRLTGDQRRASWDFLRAAAEQLVGHAVDLSDGQAALEDAATLAARWRAQAQEHDPEQCGPKPLRGSQAGLEMALLDLLARGRSQTLPDLLGQQRRRAEISASTIPSHLEAGARARRLAKHARRFPMTRVKGGGDPDGDLALLLHAAKVNRRTVSRKPLWIDVNEAFSPTDAEGFVTEVVQAARRGALPTSLVIEQPVAKADSAHLPELQELADRTARQRRRVDVRIMPDEGLWDVDDLPTVRGCRAINIKVQKTGGMLAALTLADAALAADPDTHIYLGGMLATSDITAWALRSLALSMPRLDYFTSAPPGNVEARIATPRLSYRGRSNVLIDQHELGIGTHLDRDAVVPYVRRRARRPRQAAAAATAPAAPAAPAAPGSAAAAPDTTDPDTTDPGTTLPQHGRADDGEERDEQLEGRYAGMPKKQLDSHLLEREAIAHGLTTLRSTPLLFQATSPAGGPPLGFYWTSSNRTSRPAYYLCGVKDLTRQALLEAGLPTPTGRSFSWKQREEAVRYAASLGGPVVVKPAAGSGGVGVATDLTGAKEVRWAIEAMQRRLGTPAPSFVVEQYLTGDDHRLHVVGDTVVSVIRRHPAHVVGDGRSPVTELVMAANAERRRNPSHAPYPIKLGDEAVFQLERQGLTTRSVPEAGREVRLSLAGNVVQGAHIEEVLDTTHPSILQAAAAACRAIPGLHHAGVDLIVDDRTRPLHEQRGGICEINSVPGIAGHHFPLIGPSRNLARAILVHTAAAEGVTLSLRKDRCQVRVEVYGTVQRVGFRRWVSGLGRNLDVEVAARNRDDGAVELELAGPTSGVAVIVSRCINGPRNADPTVVRSTPMP